MADQPRVVLSLNGDWDLAFDPDNVGKDEKWYESFPRAVTMHVPGVWEQIRPGYDGVGWYRKAFEAPDGWQGKTVRLRCMASGYYTECWLNGRYLGDHESAYTPFEFDLSRALEPGRNVIVARVVNPPREREIDGFSAGAPLGQKDIPLGKGGWYFNFAGLWQDVDLIVTDKVYVDDVFVQPRPSQKKATVEVTVRNGRGPRKCEITCAIAPAGRKGEPEVVKTVRVALKGGANTVSVPMAFDEVRLWSLDDPFLYSATVQIAVDGRVCDEHAVRFGMREFTLKRGRFYLNGQPVKPKGFLHQGMYPRTLSFPETREFAVKELRLLKDNGFNFIRLHLKPAPWWYMDLLDEMGILAEAEPPAGWNMKSKGFERRIRNEMLRLVKRDRNHPSVVFWSILNEAYHYSGYSWPEIKKLTARIGAEAHELDPTRLLWDTSGKDGNRPDGPSAVAWLPYSKRTVGMMDLHSYCWLPLHESSIEEYRTMGIAGMPLYVSEYGAPLVSPDFEDVIAGYTPEERKLGLEDYALHQEFYDSLRAQFAGADLAGTFGSVREMLAEANRVRGDEIRHVTAAMRANPKMAGFAICQLADASGELFGATDVWRKPKDTFRQMASVMATPLLMPEVAPRVITPGGAVALRASLVNENRLGETYEYRVDVGSGRGRPAEVFTGKVKATQEVQVPLKAKVKLDLKPGTYRARARLMQGRKMLSDQSVEFTVIREPDLRVKLVGVRDYGRTMRRFLRRFGCKTEGYGTSYRNKDVPLLMDMRGAGGHRGSPEQAYGQARKIVQLGGCAVLFSPYTIGMYECFFPELIRVQGVMRTIGYVKQHPIFEGLPSDCVIGYPYSRTYCHDLDKGEDVVAAGGEILCGGLSQHMWTRPNVYFSGASLYTVPIGRGQAVVCHMKVLDHLDDDPVARLLFANIVNYAASAIKPGGEDKLLLRAIDPLSPDDYA